jgi:YidC/Oxa1 family membrane protein insertase
LRIPGAFGFSLIGLTVFVRLILHPFFRQQTEMAKKMEELKPHLEKLSKKHKSNKQKLQEEQLKLYKQMGVNPASGCLFALIQMPVFYALYSVINRFLVNGGVGQTKIINEINKLVYFNFLTIKSAISPWFFGFNLSVSPSQYQKFGLYYLLIPAITALLQYWQISISSGQSYVTEKKDKEKKEESENMQKIMSTQMKLMFPFMIGWFSYSLPVGLSLYWNIFSIFNITQYIKK